MLNAENNVDITALKTWSAALEDESLPNSFDDTTRELLSLQLQSFKRTVNSLSQGDDWTATHYNISQGFMECFFKTPRGAIHIANYYECFVVPADIKTKKKMMSGYPNEEETIGEIELFSGSEKVGSIGNKSDLIWSVYYPYFVIVDDEMGGVHHTLSNHNEIMSLQLWNTENQKEECIAATITNILLNLSVTKGLNFKVIQPDELWKEPGEANKDSIQIGGRQLEAIPLAYLNYGMTCDNSRMAFLHCYQVLEYFFVRAQNDTILSKLQASGVLTTTPIDDLTLHKLLREYSNTQREVESLKLVLHKVIDVSNLKQYISCDPALLAQYTSDTSIHNSILIDLNATDKKIINKLAERIYFFRCSIAHAKGDVDEYLAQPDISDKTIQAELPLMKTVAFKTLQVWGR